MLIIERALAIIFAPAPRGRPLLFVASTDALLPHSMDCEDDKMVEDEECPHSNDSAEIRLERRNGIRPTQIIKWC